MGSCERRVFLNSTTFGDFLPEKISSATLKVGLSFRSLSHFFFVFPFPMPMPMPTPLLLFGGISVPMPSLLLGDIFVMVMGDSMKQYVVNMEALCDNAINEDERRQQ